MQGRPVLSRRDRVIISTTVHRGTLSRVPDPSENFVQPLDDPSRSQLTEFSLPRNIDYRNEFPCRRAKKFPSTQVAKRVLRIHNLKLLGDNQEGNIGECIYMHILLFAAFRKFQRPRRAFVVKAHHLLEQRKGAAPWSELPRQFFP